MVFSNLAIQTKRLAPNASTFLEIMRVRYGTFVHISFMFFSLAANTVRRHRSQQSSALADPFADQLVVSSVLLGGAAAINSITGMSIYAATWLLPLSVAAYTLRGGLR